MEKKINIEELLRDCPSGMELDCTMFEGIEFDDIVDNKYLPIRCRIKNPDGGYNVYFFTKHGYWNHECKAKCVIFPKGKTTWEGFVPPCQFKDGDIISNGNYIAIFYKIGTPYHCTSNSVIYYHCYYNQKYCKFRAELDFGIGTSKEFRYATEEEKEKLFKAIKDNGYKWNPETKTLEKLSEPKFKIGDRLRSKTSRCEYTIAEIRKDCYIMYYATDKFGYHVPFCGEDNYELVSNKFDINSLKPFDKVLVRDNNGQMWTADIFSFYNEKNIYPFACVGHYVSQCIPYEGNEHLLGTFHDCDEYYKVWEN